MYHSFPSMGGSDQAGLSVLKSIARHGLLLTPEDFKVGIDWSDGYQETVGFAQTRICFTLIASEELPQHADSFGRFAIEYDVSVLKRLGASPVFYLAAGGTEIVGSLMTLNDLIAELRSDAPEFAQVWDEKPHTRSLDHLEASIHGLSGYFYPVGSGAYEDDVRYFQEREWRIISRITQHGVALTEKLNPTIKEELVSMDPGYFEEEVPTLNGLKRRVDVCHLLPEHEGTHVLDLARRVIVPASALSYAAQIVDEEGRSVSVEPAWWD